MGSGQYAAADDFIEHVPAESRAPGLKLVRARMELQRGEYERALALSNEVLESASPGSQESDHALLNLVTMHFHAGKAAEARRLPSSSSDRQLQRPASTHRRGHGALMIACERDGSLESP